MPRRWRWGNRAGLRVFGRAARSHLYQPPGGRQALRRGGGTAIVRAMDMPRPVRLYDCTPAPNPRRVRIFMAEKGIELPVEQVDIMAGAQFAAHRERVGVHHVPALELDDGRFLTESPAICRYLEALWPEPNLMGEDPLEAAEIEMWSRRVEFDLLGAAAAVLRHGNAKMAVMEEQVPAWAEANRPRVLAALDRMERRLGESAYLAGERYTMADITGIVAVDFLRAVRIAVPERCVRLGAWRREIAARRALAA
jgi:glutathione S-transferase